MNRKIITHCFYPPIPMRDMDWAAYRDGDEETGKYGWGATEAEAIFDLHRLEEGEAEWHQEMTEQQEETDWEAMKPPSQIFGR